MLASMCRITVILDFRSPLTASGATYGPGVDGRILGDRGSQVVPIQRARHRIGTRERAQGLTNALEDAAQIIGGRIRSAISPAGETAGPGRQRHKVSPSRKAGVCPNVC